jgi:hypothetical protein
MFLPVKHFCDVLLVRRFSGIATFPARDNPSHLVDGLSISAP